MKAINEVMIAKRIFDACAKSDYLKERSMAEMIAGAFTFAVTLARTGGLPTDRQQEAVLLINAQRDLESVRQDMRQDPRMVPLAEALTDGNPATVLRELAKLFEAPVDEEALKKKTDAATDEIVARAANSEDQK